MSGVLYGLFTLAALFLIDWQSGLILTVMGIPMYLLMRWFYTRSQVIYGSRASSVRRSSSSSSRP